MLLRKRSRIDAGAHLLGLVGHPISTFRGEPNTILRIESGSVLVATERSPEGQRVPIEWVQEGFDRLLELGEVRVSRGALGYRGSFVAAVLLTLPGTKRATNPAHVVLCAKPVGIESLTQPSRIWSSEACYKPSPIPATSGVYGWFFKEIPHPDIDLEGCVRFDDLTLLYVGIAPKKPSANGGPPSTGNLRKRIRYHYGGNASGSTLRTTLGCLLEPSLGTQLRRVGKKTTVNFGAAEDSLTGWMNKNAFVAWVEDAEPWLWEHEAIERLDLPLNLQHNAHNPFCFKLKLSRKLAKAKALALPALPRLHDAPL